jgi:hypothetical protein
MLSFPNACLSLPLSAAVKLYSRRTYFSDYFHITYYYYHLEYNFQYYYYDYSIVITITQML